MIGEKIRIMWIGLLGYVEFLIFSIGSGSAQTLDLLTGVPHTGGSG